MIVIRNIQRTNLREYSLAKLVKKFSKSEKDISITFDARISDFGSYIYNGEKQRHEIKISSKTFQFNDPSSKTYELIGTILHELKHVQQQEDLGTRSFFSEKFALNKCIKNEAAATYYSLCEVEARLFEEKNVLSAVEYYWKCSSDVVK